MKIRIIQTIEVDPEKWAREFDIDQDQVREDVRSYFAGWIQDQVAVLGMEPDKQKKPQP